MRIPQNARALKVSSKDKPSRMDGEGRAVPNY